MDDADAYRAASRRGWGSVAAGWGRHAPTHMRAAMPVTAWMLDAAAIQPGFDLLELAAGQGEVGFMAYELAQPGGSLICSDFAPEMLSEAQRRAEALGLRGDLRFKQIDAESIDLQAGSLDVVLCRWGLMFTADPNAALRECRRVLRPGGRLTLAAWAPASENRWSSVVGEAMIERGLMEPAPTDQPGQFAWAREGLIAELLAEAGFVDDDVVVDDVSFAFRERFEDWWARSTEMSRSGEIVRSLAPAERDGLRDALRGALAEYETEDGVLEIPARTWVAAATA